MKKEAVGIIAEYNPFHAGHAYHIARAKEDSGARWCVVAMSGDFVQRGEPAVFDKYTRARMALMCGADLVVELPSVFAVSSAEDFSACGTALLDRLGVVGSLCFGSEAGDIEAIRQAAAILAGGSPYEEELERLLREGLKQGLTWPQARNRAVSLLAEEEGDFPFSPEEADRLLGAPNNLLGIEYCKALIRRNSSMEPFTLPRKGQGYHSRELSGEQASASALRRHMEQELPIEEILSHIPDQLLSLYQCSRRVTAEDCSSLLNYRLLELAQRGEDPARFGDLSPQLRDRLSGCLLSFNSWEGRIGQLKTRQYTYTRVSRALTHLLLGITRELLETGRKLDYAPYIRILGFRREAAPLLGQIKEQAQIPMITKTAQAQKLLSPEAYALFFQDLHASHVRQSIEAAKYHICPKNEYTQPVCILSEP